MKNHHWLLILGFILLSSFLIFALGIVLTVGIYIIVAMSVSIGFYIPFNSYFTILSVYENHVVKKNEPYAIRNSGLFLWFDSERKTLVTVGINENGNGIMQTFYIGDMDCGYRESLAIIEMDPEEKIKRLLVQMTFDNHEDMRELSIGLINTATVIEIANDSNMEAPHEF